MSYESPIKLTNTMESIVRRVREEEDKKIYECIANYGIDVNKEELEKALRYDRDQYVKGYEDGKAEAMQWIPCSERLPEKSGKYLGQRPYGEIIDIGFSKKHQKWNAHDSSPPEYALEIIAWMPLPPAYKEDKE